MFDHIGRKIQILAIVLCALGITASVVTGIVYISAIDSPDARRVWAGILFMFLGSLLSWVSTFVLYGFGHLIENSDTLVAHTMTQPAIPANHIPANTASAPKAAQKPAPEETPQSTTFKEKIKKVPTLTLKDIIQNPKEHLFGEKELQLIREELASRIIREELASRENAQK